MSIIRRAASSARELRSVTYGQGDPYAIPSNGSLANYSAAGVVVDKQTAMAHAAVYASVRVISSLIGSTPINTCRQEGARLRPIEQHALIDNPFGNALGAPTERQVGIEQVLVSQLLRGNSYNLVTETDRRGTPTQLLPLDPDQVRVDLTDGGGKRFWIGGKVVPTDQVVHIPGMSMPGSVVGMSPVAYLRQTIGLGLATEEFGARFFGSGAHMSGVISMEGDLDPDAARQLKQRFEARHSGLRNSHSVGVLTGGAKWTPMSATPNDSQYIDSMRFSVAQIGMIFGVPPHLLGNTQDVSAAWGMGVEPQTMAFLTYTLRAWYTRIENALSNLLPEGMVARFDTQDLLRTNSSERFRLYSAARVAGLMTTNEIRDLEGMPPIAGGDDIAQPLNSAHNGQNDQTDVNANQAKD